MTDTAALEKAPGNRLGWQKPFAVFIASQAISLFGSSLVQYAILWYITLETNSGLMMALSIILASCRPFSCLLCRGLG